MAYYYRTESRLEKQGDDTMANLIQANVIPGASVYGVPQVSYTVEGEAGKDYAAALTAAAFRESTAIEVAASSFMTVVRQRQAKVTELGDVLSTIATAMGSLKTKNIGKDDPSATSWQMDVAFERAKTICEKYGVTLNVREKEVDDVLRYYMTRGDLMRSQDDIQYALDVEDNNLQQDMVSLQSYFSRRDQALSLAASLVQKVNNTMSSGIQAIR